MTAALAGFGRENPKPGGAATYFFFYRDRGNFRAFCVPFLQKIWLTRKYIKFQCGGFC
jgi:hypothetical protein